MTLAKTKIALAVMAASALGMASFNADAQQYGDRDNTEGLYLGADYGYLRVEGEDEFDDDKDVWQGLIGYRFNSYFALEGSYIDFGDYGNDLAGAETDGYTAALKGILPLGDRIEIFARLGQLWSETEYRFANVMTESDDESMFVGAGIAFKVSERFIINAGYTLYDTSLDAGEAFEDIDDTNFETDLKQASLGLEYRF